MISNISFVSAHFRDFDWTKTLVRNICRYTPLEKIKEIILIDQDRSLESKKQLESLNSLVKVYQYPISEKHVAVYGHDHAAVLNHALKEVTGDYICLFDSDAHPMNGHWIGKCESIFEYYDAILALVRWKSLATHPCFMFFRKASLGNIFFVDKELREDTGRSVGLQLLNQGKKVFLIAPSKAFNGLWGDIYLNSIYHHNNGSYSGSSDYRLIKQVLWQNTYFRKQVINKGLYELPFADYVFYKFTNYLNNRIS